MFYKHLCCKQKPVVVGLQYTVDLVTGNCSVSDLPASSNGNIVRDRRGNREPALLKAFVLAGNMTAQGIVCLVLPYIYLNDNFLYILCYILWQFP